LNFSLNKKLVKCLFKIFPDPGKTWTASRIIISYFVGPSAHSRPSRRAPSDLFLWLLHSLRLCPVVPRCFLISVLSLTPAVIVPTPHTMYIRRLQLFSLEHCSFPQISTQMSTQCPYRICTAIIYICILLLFLRSRYTECNDRCVCLSFSDFCWVPSSCTYNLWVGIFYDFRFQIRTATQCAFFNRMNTKNF